MLGAKRLLGFVLGLLLAVPVWSVGDEVTGPQIRALGLEARLNPTVRDERVQEIATKLKGLSAEEAHTLQSDFQYAFLLQCDPEIYDTLSGRTIRVVDASLEGLFDFSDIDRDNHWEALIYVYGFFNRDVTPKIIREVQEKWDGLSDTDKAPRYPTYVHVIDAVSKPLSMGPLTDADATRAALEIVVPAMKRAFLAPPQPGTAFHPPSHAALVLGPLYERWIDDPELGGLIVKHLGDRAEFEYMMASQLPGGLAGGPPPSHMTYGYYAYIGSYLANGLARLNARSAVPALKQSMPIYHEHKAKGRVIEYTQRALLALGEEEARKDFEGGLNDAARRDENITLAVWLARNGQGETRSYGETTLGTLLDCAPDVALNTYFALEAANLKE